MNRRVEDKVKIISSEKASTVSGFISFMYRYCEKEAIIKYKKEFGGKFYYRLDIDKMLFLWGDDMFEKEVRGLLKNE